MAIKPLADRVLIEPAAAEEKKKSVLNMDINDLLKNTTFMKNKIEGLEKEKRRRWTFA